LDKHRLTIVGVAPRQFLGTDLDAADVWVPLGMTGAFTTFGLGGSGQPWYQSRTLYGFFLLARPMQGVTTSLIEAAATVGARRGFLAERLRKSAKVLSGPIIAAWGPEPRQQELSI